MSIITHVTQGRDLPDAGGGSCCMGSAAMGPGHCTCWETAYDVDQAEPRTDMAPAVRERMCSDCAFRSDSHERTGNPRFQHSDEGELDEVAAGDRPFFCHDGMRQRVAVVHPSGERVECEPESYAPPEIAGVAYKADGTPACICAG